MLWFTAILIVRALHATTVPCERPLAETLAEITRAVVGGDYNAAIRAQQNRLLPRFREELKNFEVDLLEVAVRQRHLIVIHNSSVWQSSMVGQLQRNEGLLWAERTVVFETSRAFVWPGAHGPELSPFGLEFVKFNEERGLRVHVVTWHPGAGLFRARRTGAWSALNADGTDEAVRLTHPDRPDVSIVPAVPPGKTFLLLEWTESSIIKHDAHASRELF